jgi:hypothetical protein
MAPAVRLAFVSELLPIINIANWFVINQQNLVVAVGEVLSDATIIISFSLH